MQKPASLILSPNYALILLTPIEVDHLVLAPPPPPMSKPIHHESLLQPTRKHVSWRASWGMVWHVVLRDGIAALLAQEGCQWRVESAAFEPLILLFIHAFTARMMFLSTFTEHSGH